MSIKRGDIFFIDLSDSKGSVQRGSRPCLIIQNNVGNMYSPTTIVIPITSTSNKQNLPTHLRVEKSYANGLKQTSWILAEQILTVSIKHQIKNKSGHLEREYMDIVNKALKISIGL